MSDDFANNWGSSYVLIEHSRRRSNKRTLTDCYLSDDKQSEIELRSIIKDTTKGQFSLEKLTPNGSDANLFAITSLSKGDTNCVLVGCGSYISGDLGPLQSWSTADFRVNDGPSYIYAPTCDDISSSARARTIALPYCIQGIMGTRGQDSYEDLCLNHIHKRCMYQHTLGQPVKVLFLELLLASNGSTLSIRFLERLGQLSTHHGFYIIVDEILTGARTNHMLLTMTSPKNFIDRVAYVTLGKWCKCGIVLVGRQFDIELEETKQSMDARGVTTGLSCSTPLPYFQKVQELLDTIPIRRSKCISKFPSLTEGQTWGAGLIIFIPRRCMGTRTGTKNRLLPLLNNTPVDNFKSVPEPGWSRCSVNHQTLRCVMKWTNQVCFIPSHSILDSNLLCIYYMLCYFVDHHKEDGWITSSDIHERVTKCCHQHENSSLRYTTTILRAIEKAGYIKKDLKTNRRLHVWTMVSTRVAYPWIISSIHSSSD